MTQDRDRIPSDTGHSCPVKLTHRARPGQGGWVPQALEQICQMSLTEQGEVPCASDLVAALLDLPPGRESSLKKKQRALSSLTMSPAGCGPVFLLFSPTKNSFYFY